MAHLAGVLGQVGDEKFSPVTDEPHGLLPFVDPHSHKTAPIRKVVLQGILPAPNSEIARRYFEWPRIPIRNTRVNCEFFQCMFEHDIFSTFMTKVGDTQRLCR